MAMDFELWAKEYEREYRSIIKYQDMSGNSAEEKSPYFTSISEVLQRKGYLVKKEFIDICCWKTQRQKKNYEVNSEDKIKKITRQVIFLHQETGEQIKKLIQLNGVGIPVASTILTVIFPKYYCILDYRAWRALFWLTHGPVRFENYSDFSGVLDELRNYATLESYIFYLEKIKNLASEHSMSPRQVEMALYSYDTKKGIK